MAAGGGVFFAVPGAGTRSYVSQKNSRNCTIWEEEFPVVRPTPECSQGGRYLNLRFLVGRPLHQTKKMILNPVEYPREWGIEGGGKER